MKRPPDEPLRHPFLERAAPGVDALDARAAFFAGKGEWPHAVSALWTADRRERGSSRAARIEDLRNRWRAADGDHDAAERLRHFDFKRTLEEARNASAAGEPDLLRDCWYLREALRRIPDAPRAQHLLSIAWMRWLDQGQPAADDPAYDGYLAIDDAGELAHRVEHLVRLRSGIPHWLIVCPNSSGTWQLRDYVKSLQGLGRSRFLVDTHKYRKQRFQPFKSVKRSAGWLAFSHLSNFTTLPFIVAGNLHDPVHATLYTSVRKTWLARFATPELLAAANAGQVPQGDVDAVREQVQAWIDTTPANDLSKYFRANYQDSFGLALDDFQIRHQRRGYFVGFSGRLTFVLTRLADLETVLAPMLDDILGIQTADCRPPGEFRITSEPALSSRLRSLAGQIAVPRRFIEDSLDTGFMERHFLPEQLQAMRDRWLPGSN